MLMKAAVPKPQVSCPTTLRISVAARLHHRQEGATNMLKKTHSLASLYSSWEAMAGLTHATVEPLLRR